MTDTLVPALSGPGAPIWVAAVALIAPDGRVLMQRRPASSEHGGLWEFPGGKLEPGETPEAAAVRELAEELSISVLASDIQPSGFVTNGAGTAGQGAHHVRPLVILLFRCTRWQGEPAPSAADEIAWCRPEDLSRLPMPPLDYPLAANLCRLLHIDAF